jgi:hypothetical protein
VTHTAECNDHNHSAVRPRNVDCICWWRDMVCWNGLSGDQQEFLRTEGYLPIGFFYDGYCRKPIQVEIITIHDEFPGPRFYCAGCAIEYLSNLREEVK